jgi:hypothetical protein
MKIFIISVLMCVCLWGQVFYPIQDSYVFENLPDTNFGASDTLCIRSNVSNWGYITRTLFKFDLSPISPGTAIQSAILGLYMFNQSGVDFEVEVHCILEPWDEMGVTWNNQPQYDSSIAGILDYQGYTWWEFDITDLVQFWVDNPTLDYGALLKFETEQYLDSLGRVAMFYSRDTAFSTPYLDIQTMGINEKNCTEIGDLQIAPNPFCKTATLTFSTMQNNNMTISLYDISGRKRETIYSGILNKGCHSFLVNSRDIASGIYFLKMESPDNILFKNIIIVK